MQRNLLKYIIYSLEPIARYLNVIEMKTSHATLPQSWRPLFTIHCIYESYYKPAKEQQK